MSNFTELPSRLRSLRAVTPRSLFSIRVSTVVVIPQSSIRKTEILLSVISVTFFAHEASGNILNKGKVNRIAGYILQNYLLS